MLMIYKTTFSQKIQLTEDVFLFRFQLLEPKEISFKAGQYLILKINDKPRLYSFASPDFQKDSFELLVQIVPGGLASTYLSGLKVGDRVMFQGPAGVFNLRESSRPKIFLATGTGIAPMRSIIKSEIEKLRNTEVKKLSNDEIKEKENLNYSLFWGLKTYKDVYLLEELKEMEKLRKEEIEKLSNEEIKEKDPNYQLPITNYSYFDFKICLSREQNLEMVPEEDRGYFAIGHVTDGLESVISPTTNHQSPITNFDFYLCGSPVVVESLRKYLEEKGALKEQIFFEKF